jgi:signal transduction histidine kinase
MENACKYADDKTCHVFVESSGKDITVQVKDNGIGIPQADLSKIFEPFYRGRNTTNIKGHGIGLSMVRGILKLHDGTIDIQTKEGVGTTITVRLRNLNAEKSLEAIS